ncbi:hypothetical protein DIENCEPHELON_64 [Klebsiella phage vB_KaeS_Diencephalon]|nr:hypothetical protein DIENCEPHELON_64 [Klebsiella phage vB_KaeS_Diencephalon]
MSDITYSLWIALRVSILLDVLAIAVLWASEWRMNRSIKAVKFFTRHRDALAYMKLAVKVMGRVTGLMFLALVLSMAIGAPWTVWAVLVFFMLALVASALIHKWPRRDKSYKYTLKENLAYIIVLLWIVFSSAVTVAMAVLWPHV